MPALARISEGIFVVIICYCGAVGVALFTKYPYRTPFAFEVFGPPFIKNDFYFFFVVQRNLYVFSIFTCAIFFCLMEKDWENAHAWKLFLEDFLIVLGIALVAAEWVRHIDYRLAEGFFPHLF